MAALADAGVRVVRPLAARGGALLVESALDGRPAWVACFTAAPGRPARKPDDYVDPVLDSWAGLLADLHRHARAHPAGRRERPAPLARRPGVPDRAAGPGPARRPRPGAAGPAGRLAADAARGRRRLRPDPRRPAPRQPQRRGRQRHRLRLRRRLPALLPARRRGRRHLDPQGRLGAPRPVRRPRGRGPLRRPLLPPGRARSALAAPAGGVRRLPDGAVGLLGQPGRRDRRAGRGRWRAGSTARCPGGWSSCGCGRGRSGRGWRRAKACSGHRRPEERRTMGHGFAGHGGGAGAARGRSAGGAQAGRPARRPGRAGPARGSPWPSWASWARPGCCCGGRRARSARGRRLARARCLAAEAEVALAARDLAWPARALDEALRDVRRPRGSEQPPATPGCCRSGACCCWGGWTRPSGALASAPSWTPPGPGPWRAIAALLAFEIAAAPGADRAGAGGAGRRAARRPRGGHPGAARRDRAGGARAGAAGGPAGGRRRAAVR